MNELQTVLNQFKQGLTQNVFYYFEELTRVTSTEDATSFVVEELESLSDTFSERKGSGSLFSALEGLESTWKEKALKAKEAERYDEVLHAEDILKAIKTVRVISQEE